MKNLARASCLLLLTLPVGEAWGNAIPPEFHKSDQMHNLPDFGQVSRNWCWAAAAANSLYWYAKHGYPGILDDPLVPGDDQNLDGLGRIADGFGVQHDVHKLVIEVARIAGVPFSQPIWKSNYLNALQKFLQDHGVDLVIHDIAASSQAMERYAGPFSDPLEAPDPMAALPTVVKMDLNPLIDVRFAPPAWEDIQRALLECQDVTIWLCPDGDGICHVVTVEGWRTDLTNPTGWEICLADPWTPLAPDTNTDPTRMNYEWYDVLTVNPLRIDYGARQTVSDVTIICPRVFAQPIPEPATMLVVFLGASGVGMHTRNRVRAAA